MTLKEMLDSVMLESGLDTATTYFANTDNAVLRLTNLANRSAIRLSRAFDWQGLRTTYLLTMTSSKTYPLPDDFRALIPDTGFTDDHYLPVDFATNPTLWAYLGSTVGAIGPRYRVRILGGLIQIENPEADTQLKFEYLKNTPVLASDGTSKQRFTADTDTFALDDDLLMMDLIWRHKKLLGLDWQEDFGDFKDYFRTTKGQDAGAKTIIGHDEDFIPGIPWTDLYVNNEAS